MFAEPLRAIDLIVADSQIISGYPDDRSLGPESFVLEGSLHELVSFVRCEVFDLVVDAMEEGIPNAILSLSLEVLRGVALHMLVGCRVRVFLSSRVVSKVL